jgi:hypothetical protein
MEPSDEHVVITGNAPSSESSRCVLYVGAIGSHVIPQGRVVEGAFKESFVIYRNRRGHRVSLACGGGVGVVAERTFKYGRDVNEGGEVPLDGHAP